MYKQSSLLFFSLCISTCSIFTSAPQKTFFQSDKVPQGVLYSTRFYFANKQPNHIFKFNGNLLNILSISIPATNQGVEHLKTTLDSLEFCEETRSQRTTQPWIREEQGFPTPFYLEEPQLLPNGTIRIYSHITTDEQQYKLLKQVQALVTTRELPFSSREITRTER